MSHLKAEVKQGTLPLARQEASLTPPPSPAGTRKLAATAGVGDWGMTKRSQPCLGTYSMSTSHHTRLEVSLHIFLWAASFQLKDTVSIRFDDLDSKGDGPLYKSPFTQENHSQSVTVRGRFIYGLFSHSLFSYQQIY